MDNLTWTPEELRLINLEATVEYEFIERNSTKFNEHLNLLYNYKGRHDANYNPEHISNAITHHNRFNIGAVKIILDGELSRSLMVENYRGWMLLSRLISHNHPRLPLLTGYGSNFIVDIANANGCVGMFATMNRRNKMYMNCFDTTRFKLFNKDNPLFNRHREAILGIQRLEGTRTFMYSEQYIVYRGNGDIEEVFK
jgi:hypothetical protein